MSLPSNSTVTLWRHSLLFPVLTVTLTCEHCVGMLGQPASSASFLFPTLSGSLSLWQCNVTSVLTNVSWVPVAHGLTLSCVLDHSCQAAGIVTLQKLNAEAFVSIMRAGPGDSVGTSSKGRMLMSLDRTAYSAFSAEINKKHDSHSFLFFIKILFWLQRQPTKILMYIVGHVKCNKQSLGNVQRYLKSLETLSKYKPLNCGQFSAPHLPETR